MGKKIWVDDKYGMVLNKKDFNFFSFLAHLPQKVDDPWYLSMQTLSVIGAF